MSTPLRIAIVGAGPAALYAAAELAGLRDPLVSVNMIDRLPSIGGLARSGVAPDHAQRRQVVEAYEKLARSGGRFEFFGNVAVDRDIRPDELLHYHHAVIYAVGASQSRPLEVPGAELQGCWPAARFVGWYNGHPDDAALEVDLDYERALVIGNGNVAIDIARVLLKSADELADADTAEPARRVLAASHIREVVILGRRGPAQASFTHPELRELGTLRDTAVEVEPADLAGVDWPAGDFAMAQRRACLERYAAGLPAGRTKRLGLKFLTSPVAILGEDKVTGVTTAHNRLETGSDGRVHAVPTGETGTLAAGLVVHALGYRASPLPGIAFNGTSGTIPNHEGRVVDGAAAAGTYVTGWIKRGPRGVIGSNKRCAAQTIRTLLTDFRAGRLPAPQFSNDEFIALLHERQPGVVDYRGWKAIDRHEKAHAADGAPRRKLCSIREMLRVAGVTAS